MKNRALVISLSVVAAAAVAAAIVLAVTRPEETTPQPTAPDNVMVGSPRDFDESLAFFECNAGGPVMRWFVSKVNNAGGVHLSKYDADVPIELVERDFSVSSWDITTVAQGLIDDGAKFMWGGPSTDTIYSLAPVCNNNKVVLSTLEGGASKMIWDHQDYLDKWPYVWVNLSFANWYEIPVLHDMLAAELGREPIAYVTYIGGAGAEHGLEYLQETINEFGKANVLPAGSPLPGVQHPFEMTSDDATTIIQGAMAALGDPSNPNYDIFCGYTYPWNVAALTVAAEQNGFNPPAMIFGPGANFGTYSADFGNSTVNGVCSFTMANKKTTVAVGTPTISMPDLFDELAGQIEDDWVHDATVCPKPAGATSGSEYLDYWGIPCYAAGLEMWKYGLEDVGDIDPTAVRNAFASYSSANPASTCFGDTWYAVFPGYTGGNYTGTTGGGALDYKCHTGEIGQWQSGTYETVGYTGITSELPNYCITSSFVYPMTDKWGWLAS
jgi:hypothetical protein